MAASKKQNCVSNSTAEAELIATCTALRNTGLPALNVWDRVLGRKSVLTLCEDNMAMIKIIKNGISPSMKYLGRTHGVSLASTKEMVDKNGVIVRYVGTEEMKADILTKGYGSGATWEKVRRLVNVGSRIDIIGRGP